MIIKGNGELYMISNDSLDRQNKELRKWIIGTGILFSIISLFGPNPLLCTISFITLYFVTKSLFISRFTVGFFFAYFYQWTQISIKPLFCTVSFINIKEYTKFPDEIISAFVLSSIGLVIISYAIGLTLRKFNFNDKIIFNRLNEINFVKLLIAYATIGFVAGLIPSVLQQFAVQFIALKWGLFYLLFMSGIQINKYRWILFIIIIFEFVLGFASYFASWKVILFYTILGFFSVFKLNSKIIMIAVGMMIPLIYFAIFWTGVKGEFRHYISQGQGQQMLVSKSEALAKIQDLQNSFTVTDKIQRSFIDRMSYIDYFSSCISYVPSQQPHENGQLTVDAIKHVLMPRIIFKSKGIIDESSHLTKYTGVFYSNYSMGVSFSLGYFGDLYVDFGPIGMMIAIFLIGYLIGLLFISIYKRIECPVLGIALLQMSFLLLYKFEISLLKLIGTLITFWILYYILAKWGFPQLSKWLFDEK